MATATMKRCTRGDHDRPLKEFTLNSKTSDGRGSWCHECFAEYNRGRYKQTRAQVRDQHLRRWFGMTLVEYHAMLAEQNGVCAICGGDEPREGASLAVDHDQATGQIRSSPLLSM